MQRSPPKTHSSSNSSLPHSGSRRSSSSASPAHRPHTLVAGAAQPPTPGRLLRCQTQGSTGPCRAGHIQAVAPHPTHLAATQPHTPNPPMLPLLGRRLLFQILLQLLLQRLRRKAGRPLHLQHPWLCKAGRCHHQARAAAAARAQLLQGPLQHRQLAVHLTRLHLPMAVRPLRCKVRSRPVCQCLSSRKWCKHPTPQNLLLPLLHKVHSSLQCAQVPWHHLLLQLLKVHSRLLSLSSRSGVLQPSSQQLAAMAVAVVRAGTAAGMAGLAVPVGLLQAAVRLFICRMQLLQRPKCRASSSRQW